MLLTEPSPFKKMLLFGVPGGDLVIRDPLGKLCDSQSLILKGFQISTAASGTSRLPAQNFQVVLTLFWETKVSCFQLYFGLGVGSRFHPRMLEPRICSH